MRKFFKIIKKIIGIIIIFLIFGTCIVESPDIEQIHTNKLTNYSNLNTYPRKQIKVSQNDYKQPINILNKKR